jgi:hypothetical protein
MARYARVMAMGHAQSFSRRSIRAVAALLTLVMALVVAAQVSGQGQVLLRIKGGRFEASGVVNVPGTNGVLFVDDGRRREVFWAEFDDNGQQRGRAIPVPLGADITDLEGITADGTYFYVVGSQSKLTGFEGDGLARFTFDPKTRRVGRMERLQGLKAWLADHVGELRGTAQQLGDAVLNIEGLAWDPRGRRLLLGLRAPVIEGQALVIPLQIRDPSGPLTVSNLAVENGKALRLSLDGAGIRSLEYDEPSGAYRIIAGAGLDAEDRDFRILEWDGPAGTGRLREIGRYARQLKPEGISRASIGGRRVNLVVFDTGRFALFP